MMLLDWRTNMAVVDDDLDPQIRRGLKATVKVLKQAMHHMETSQDLPTLKEALITFRLARRTYLNTLEILEKLEDS